MSRIVIFKRFGAVDQALIELDVKLQLFDLSVEERCFGEVKGEHGMPKITARLFDLPPQLCQIDDHDVLLLKRAKVRLSQEMLFVKTPKDLRCFDKSVKTKISAVVSRPQGGCDEKAHRLVHCSTLPYPFLLSSFRGVYGSGDLGQGGVGRRALQCYSPPAYALMKITNVPLPAKLSSLAFLN